MVESTGTSSQQTSQPPSAEFQSIPIDRIRPSPHQARKTFDDASIQALAESIRQEGLLQPITVRRVGDTAVDDVGRLTNFYELIGGERRFRAVKLLGWTAIDAKVITTISEAEAAAKGMIENLQREDLNPLEEAEGLAALNRLDPDYWTQTKIAEVTGKTQGDVSRTIRFLDFSDEIKSAIRRRIISVGHAVELLRIQEPKLQVRMADKIEKHGLSVMKTRDLIDKLLKVGPTARPSASKPGIAADTDPLYVIWAELLFSPKIQATGAWGVTFKKGLWNFTVKSGLLSTKEALVTWFRQMADALESSTSTQPFTTNASKPLYPVRLPKNSAEEADLSKLAEEGPVAIYRWIYGSESSMVKLMGNPTWKELGTDNPQKGLKKILAALRRAHNKI